MQIAAQIRADFLAQNAYTEDAFSEPANMLDIIRSITDQYIKGGAHSSSKSEK